MRNWPEACLERGRVSYRGTLSDPPRPFKFRQPPRKLLKTLAFRVGLVRLGQQVAIFRLDRPFLEVAEHAFELALNFLRIDRRIHVLGRDLAVELGVRR